MSLIFPWLLYCVPAESLKKYIYLFIYLLWKTDSCHLLVYSPNVHNSWGWAGPKPGTKNSIQVSHRCGRDSTTGAVSGCLSGCMLAGPRDWEQSWDLSLSALVWDAGVPSSIFSCAKHQHHCWIFLSLSPWLHPFPGPRICFDNSLTCFWVPCSTVSNVFSSKLAFLSFPLHLPHPPTTLT